MKSKDYFSKLVETGKIENEEIKKFIETAPDFEIPDVLFSEFENNFMTRERAMADQKVRNHIRKEVFDGFESNLKKFEPLLDDLAKTEINAERDSYKKVSMIVAAVGNAIDRAKTAGGDQTEAVKALEKTRDELVTKIKTISSEFETEKSKLLADFEAEKELTNVDYFLSTTLNKFELAKEHVTLKDAIFDVIKTDLKKNNVLKIDKTNPNGQPSVFNADGSPKFDGNTPVTIDKLLEAKIAPYLKRNAGGEPPNPSGNGNPPPVERKTPPADPSQMTLAQRQRAAYL